MFSDIGLDFWVGLYGPGVGLSNTYGSLPIWDMLWFTFTATNSLSNLEINCHPAAKAGEQPRPHTALTPKDRVSLPLPT